jgi:acylphosphatase
LAETDLDYREMISQIRNLKNGDVEIVWEQERFAVVKAKAALAAARSCS